MKGADRFLAKLALIPERLKDAVRAEMELQAEQIVQFMRRLAPVRSGALRASIGWTWDALPKGTFAVATAEVPGGVSGRETLRLTIYAGGKGPGGDAFYARYVEFGTRPHALARNASVERGHRQDQGDWHPGARAQPFFYPAFRAAKGQFRNRVQRALRKALKES